MERYEGTKMIKTFRGQIVDGGQDTILLHTNDGSTGYRIVKFSVIAKAPGTATQENVSKIYKVSQTTIDANIDFSDNKLVAAAYYENNFNSTDFGGTVIIFDQEIFNQDIFISNTDASGNGNPLNYYIELEQVKLDLSENTVATLKDIRNTA